MRITIQTAHFLMDRSNNVQSILFMQAVFSIKACRRADMREGQAIACQPTSFLRSFSKIAHKPFARCISQHAMGDHSGKLQHTVAGSLPEEVALCAEAAHAS
jgi:hypothetical protein